MLEQHIRNALLEHKQAIDSLVENEEVVSTLKAAAEAMAECLRSGGRIFSCGNGGSMCDAMHFAEEMTGRFRSSRPAYSAAAISDPAHIACVGNDYGYDEVFARYIEAHGREGDVLIGITTSGTSRNVLRAFEAARAKGMRLVALTGRKDCPAVKAADYALATPGGRWADRVQEQHILCIHILIEMIERQLDPANYA